MEWSTGDEGKYWPYIDVKNPHRVKPMAPSATNRTGILKDGPGKPTGDLVPVDYCPKREAKLGLGMQVRNQTFDLTEALFCVEVSEADSAKIDECKFDGLR